MQKIWTVLDLINWGKDFFAQKGIDSPRLTIELMLCEVLKVRRIDLYAQFDRPLKDDELARLREMTKRRAGREPLQYILGNTEFYGLPLVVTPDVLIPRPETEILVEAALKHCKNSGSKVLKILDIGTGSGCIAIALAVHLPEAEITAIDVSDDALKTAQKNAQLNNVQNVTFSEVNILEELPEGAPFDVIVSNPPYIADEAMEELEPELFDHEPHEALSDGADGYTFYRKFASIFKNLLKPDGKFFVEIGHGQAERVEAGFKRGGYEVEFLEDFEKIPRVVVGRFLKA
jgi:release factor glutamine methyltransferase